jgi:hypothetical protein
MADEKKPALSFGFSKRADPVKLKASAINDGEIAQKEERDFLLSVEDRKINRFGQFKLLYYSGYYPLMGYKSAAP